MSAGPKARLLDLLEVLKLAGDWFADDVGRLGPDDETLHDAFGDAASEHGLDPDRHPLLWELGHEAFCEGTVRVVRRCRRVHPSSRAA